MLLSETLLVTQDVLVEPEWTSLPTRLAQYCIHSIMRSLERGEGRENSGSSISNYIDKVFNCTGITGLDDEGTKADRGNGADPEGATG